MTAVERLRGALADRYSIEREIGAGGMATVYLARDLRHERDVALKVLKPELGAVLGTERFLSEIRVTAKLQHPNLLPLFDSGTPEGKASIRAGRRMAGACVKVRSFEISPDDRRFLMMRSVESNTPERLIIVDNWFEELRSRAAKR